MTPLELAKDRLTIPDLVALRGWSWKPGRECRCPYRPDKNPSGSVLSDGRLFHDFASGETLDAPALLSRVEEMSNEAACRLFIQLAAVTPCATRHNRAHQAKDSLSSPNGPLRGKPELPCLAKPAHVHVRALAHLRGLSVEGIRFAARRGFLYVARFRGFMCWALTDETRRLCQLRRLDGQLFPRRDGGGYKAHTCRGSRQSWPLGIREASKELCIALVEGGGDFLAACHFIVAERMDWHVAPVAVLGAGHRIAVEALRLFAGKRVRIFAHVDKPNPRNEHSGIEAAARWEDQLQKVGAIVTTFDLSGLTRADGVPAKDLNDLAQISPDTFKADPELSALMSF